MGGRCDGVEGGERCGGLEGGERCAGVEGEDVGSKTNFSLRFITEWLCGFRPRRIP